MCRGKKKQHTETTTEKLNFKLNQEVKMRNGRGGGGGGGLGGGWEIEDCLDFLNYSGMSSQNLLLPYGELTG